MSLAIYILYVLEAKMVNIINKSCQGGGCADGRSANRSCAHTQSRNSWRRFVCLYLNLNGWVWVWEFTWQLSHGGWFLYWILYVETNNWQQLRGEFVFEPLYVHGYDHRPRLQLLVILCYCYFHTVEMSVYPLRALWIGHTPQRSIITAPQNQMKLFENTNDFDLSHSIKNSRIVVIRLKYTNHEITLQNSKIVIDFTRYTLYINSNLIQQ